MASEVQLLAPSTDAADVVRSGYAHCAQLRRLMAIEEHALSATSSGGTVALTRRVGCDCDYEEY